MKSKRQKYILKINGTRDVDWRNTLFDILGQDDYYNIGYERKQNDSFMQKNVNSGNDYSMHSF